jgi:hypothetical protein
LGGVTDAADATKAEKHKMTPVTAEHFEKDIFTLG